MYQINDFPKWIFYKNTTFNSFITSKSDLNSTVYNNLSIPSCSRLYFKEMAHNSVMYAWCYEGDPNCPRRLTASSPVRSTFAPLNDVCKLEGKFTNSSIILENHGTDQSFIYIFIDGCYNFKGHYTWSITNNTYLKYSIDDVKKTNTSKNLFFVVGNKPSFACDCSCLCMVLHCANSSKPVMDEEPRIEVFVETLYAFGILVAIVTFIGLGFGIYKYFHICV